MSGPPRLIVGNLDCESDFAREHAKKLRDRGEGRVSPGDPRFALASAALRSVAAFGTLLRAFAREGDMLWLPHPVDPSRMARVDAIPLPALASGPLDSLGVFSDLLAWAETPAVSRRMAAITRHPRAMRPEDSAAPSFDAPWRLPAPRANPGSQIQNRAFCLETARELGLALPGACIVRSVGELEAHLRAGGASLSPGGKWVAKAPFSAAGRSRAICDDAASAGLALKQAGRLLELHGELLFEPWLDRTEDFGCAAFAGEREARALPVHRLLVDARGRFRGIGLEARSAAGSLLDPEESALLSRAVEGAAARLRQAGHAGPFSIDCWRHRGSDGVTRFHPFGEINARLTFGHVARALADRLLDEGVLEPGAEVSLRTGKPDSRSALRPGGPQMIQLLQPGPQDPGAAWLEVASRDR